MKLINKLDETNDKSLYSGKSTSNYEMFLRAIPTVDKDGNPLKASKRYYVFRLLNFQTDERTYPFIVRNEHEYFRKDSTGKVLEVKRICCPSTLWAKKQINETVGKDYCPICKLSYEQNVEAWKNFKTNGQIDSTCQQISKDTKARWAVYIPVLVVSDPSYERNNNHLRVLRLTGEEGKATFNLIRAVINEANEKNINVFNGEEGANIAILCEKKQKFSVKKDGTPVIDPKTGEQRSYMANSVTDVRLLSTRLHSYPMITEEAIEKLNFDENYNVAATRDQLNVFMNENYLDTGASESDFGDGFDDSEFDSPSKTASTSKNNTAVVEESDEFDEPIAETKATQKNDDVFTADDLDDDIDESPKEAIARITKGKSASTGTVKIPKTAELPPDTEKLRNDSTTFSDDDLPF